MYYFKCKMIILVQVQKGDQHDIGTFFSHEFIRTVEMFVYFCVHFFFLKNV